MKLHYYQKTALIILSFVTNIQAAEIAKPLSKEQEYDVALRKEYAARAGMGKYEIVDWDEFINRRLLDAVVEKNPVVERVQYLLAKKANPSYKSTHPFRTGTPLSYAAGGDHERIVQLLLQAKADVNQMNQHDDTPLACAIKTCSISSARQLLWAGAKLDAIHWPDMIPFIFCPEAEKNISMTTFLIAHDAHPKKLIAALDRSVKHVGRIEAKGRRMGDIIKMLYLSLHTISSYPHTFELPFVADYGRDGTFITTYQNVITVDEAKKIMGMIEKEKEASKIVQPKS